MGGGSLLSLMAMADNYAPHQEAHTADMAACDMSEFAKLFDEETETKHDPLAPRPIAPFAAPVASAGSTQTQRLVPQLSGPTPSMMASMHIDFAASSEVIPDSSSSSRHSLVSMHRNRVERPPSELPNSDVLQQLIFGGPSSTSNDILLPVGLPSQLSIPFTRQHAQHEHHAAAQEYELPMLPLMQTHSRTISTMSDNLPPLRPLSAYNFFFRDERDRLLNNTEPDWSEAKQDQLLEQHWSTDRSKKRRHRKTHGKINFTNLSKLISKRWKELHMDHKEFYRQVAARDWKRYQTELLAYRTMHGEEDAGL